MKKKFCKCQLCQRKIADKTNSHIIPSFLVCMATSADGTGKRNHELIYSIGNLVKAYTGNEVPMEVMNRNFDDLSEERLETELTKNDVSMDYVFCSSCEKRLGNYLESPYGQVMKSGGKIDADTQYFFWMSVLWRISHFRLLEHSLPKFMATELRKSLDQFMTNKNTGSKEEVVQRYPFSYRIIRCKDYSKDGAGCFYAQYDKKNQIYSLSLGEIIVCFCFKDGDLPTDYDFIGLRDEFAIAPANDGSSKEVVKDVSSDVFDKAYDVVIQKAQKKYVENEVEMICKLWRKLLKLGCPLPPGGPSEDFIRCCLQNIHDESKKNGEKHTHHNFALSFREALQQVYGIVIPDK